MIGDTSHMLTLGQQDGQGAYRLALDDFKRARKRAAVSNLLSRFSGKSPELLSFWEVTEQLKETGRHDLGLRDIPLAAIIGSVGRTTDFDRDFLPLRQSDAERWARVKVAGMGVKELPPIEVYQIGESYFVQDGNHRVSIARLEGVETILARVIEVITRAPLPADARPDDLILAAEQADFLEQTRLDKTRPEADVRVSFPGHYQKLENHIALHRCFLEANETQFCRTVPEAAGFWYDEAFVPVIEAIREGGFLRDFPGWTETDLYLWVTENQERLKEELGWSIQPASVVSNLAGEIGRGSRTLHLRRPIQLLSSLKSQLDNRRPDHRKWMEQRFLNRYSHYLFSDILVPLGPDVFLVAGDQGPLGQALVVADREGGNQPVEERQGAQVLGLVVFEEKNPAGVEALESFREVFERHCEAAGVDGVLAVEEGDFAATIQRRATLADLVVLDRRFLAVDQNQEKGALDVLRTLKQADRPVLLARKWTSPLERILLALDSKAGIGMTLFLATYLAERWGSELIVLCDGKKEEDASGPLDERQRYLALHEVEAPFLYAESLAAGAIAEAANDQGCDVIVMKWPATGRVIGRTPEDVMALILDNCRQPVLICP